MTRKTKTPRKIILEMYHLYQQRIPVEQIAARYGLTRAGVYWLFEQENLSLERKKWDEITAENLEDFT